MTHQRRVPVTLFVGLGAVVPWLAWEVLADRIGAGDVPLWLPAVILPATLAAAAGGLMIARTILASAARAPGVALVGGATLGFAVGRTLVQPIWSRAAPSAWIGFSVAVVLALTLVGAYVAASSTLAASRRSRHPA